MRIIHGEGFREKERQEARDVKMRRMEEDNAPGLDESEQKDKRGGNPSHYEHTTPFSENVAKIQKRVLTKSRIALKTIF